MTRRKNIKLRFFLLLFAFILSACAGPQTFPPVISPTCPVPVQPTVPGVFHTVKKGETLWRISRNYGVNLNELAKFNNISNACKLEVGQKIFIPNELKKETPQTGRLPSHVDFIWPYRGPVISCFQQKKLDTKNCGIDILSRPGAPIRAACAGNVIFSSNNMRGYGKTIIIRHSNTFTTVYTNQSRNLVKAGDYVTQGQTIAYAGSTGRASQSSVHFELRKNGKPQNPLLYLP